MKGQWAGQPSRKPQFLTFEIKFFICTKKKVKLKLWNDQQSLTILKGLNYKHSFQLPQLRNGAARATKVIRKKKTVIRDYTFNMDFFLKKKNQLSIRFLKSSCPFLLTERQFCKLLGLGWGFPLLNLVHFIFSSFFVYFFNVIVSQTHIFSFK